MSIETSIFDRLNDPSVTAYVADRITPTDPPENVLWPFVVFRVTSNDPVTSMSGATGLSSYSLDLDVWARSLSEVTAIADAITARLHCYHGGSIQYATKTDQAAEELGSDEEGDICHATQKYTIWYSGATITATPDSTGTVSTGPNSVSLAACDHVLTLDCDGLTLDGGPVTGGGSGADAPCYHYTVVTGTPGAGELRIGVGNITLSPTDSQGFDIDTLLANFYPGSWFVAQGPTGSLSGMCGFNPGNGGSGNYSINCTLQQTGTINTGDDLRITFSLRGTSGATGSTGSTGPQGPAPAQFRYQYHDPASTGGNVPAGKLGVSGFTFYINPIDGDGADLTSLLTSMPTGTNFRFQKRDDPSQYVYGETGGAFSPSGGGSYATSVNHLLQYGSPGEGDDLVFWFGLRGQQGLTGDPGTNGTNGTNGNPPGVRYLWQSGASSGSGPAPGTIQANGSGALEISDTDADGNNLNSYLSGLSSGGRSGTLSFVHGTALNLETAVTYTGMGAGMGYHGLAGQTVYGPTPSSEMVWMVGCANGLDGATGPKGDKGDTGDTGSAGTGNLWFVGSGAPGGSGTNTGDLYLNTANGNVYQWSGSSWGSPIENITGPTGATGATGSNGTGNNWFHGSGAPTGAGSFNGDLYLNTSNGDVYYWDAGGASWYPAGLNLTGPTGAAGSNGTNGTNGVGVPTGGTTGQVLAKQSNTDYDTVWITDTDPTPGGSSGDVQTNDGAGGFSGITGISGTLTFDAVNTGSVTSLTVTNGVITAVTTL